MKTPQNMDIQTLVQGTQTTPKQPTFSDEERDRVGYFFLRLANVFGQILVDKNYPGEALKFAKREHAKDIIKFDREGIDRIFGRVKELKKQGEMQYPNISEILGVLDRNDTHWEHRAFEIQARETAERLALPKPERNKSVGADYLAKMKASLSAV